MIAIRADNHWYSTCMYPSTSLETHTIAPIGHGHWQIRLHTCASVGLCMAALLWSDSRLTTDWVCFCFSLPKAEKTSLIGFHGISDSTHNCDFYFGIAIFFFADTCILITWKCSRYRNRIKKGIVTFDVIVLSPKLTPILFFLLTSSMWPNWGWKENSLVPFYALRSSAIILLVCTGNLTAVYWRSTGGFKLQTHSLVQCY